VMVRQRLENVLLPPKKCRVWYDSTAVAVKFRRGLLPHQISSGDVDGAGEQWKKEKRELTRVAQHKYCPSPFFTVWANDVIILSS
jgi:hypothetical protein